LRLPLITGLPAADMLTTKEIFLIAALFCLVMILALSSFKGQRVRGINALLLANVLGMAANLAYAFGREMPALLAYEGADTLYAAAAATALIGFRRLSGRTAPVRAVLLAVAANTVLIGVFHYLFDSFTCRTLVVSIFQAGVAGDIGYSVLRSRKEWRASGYSLLFALGMCGADAAGHLFRGIGQIFLSAAPRSLLEPSGWNLLFLSAGAAMLPVLTLSGLLLIHRKLLALAEHAANRDFLTGAWSRRAFFDVAEREISRAKRGRLALSVLLIDLDEMKGVNDSLGHAAGDEMLVCFVDEAQSKLRAADVLGRLGGDEFAVLMPGTDVDGAVIVAERLKTQRKTDEIAEPPKFSAGLATLRDDDTLQTFLNRADVALYEAKAQGGNQTAMEASSTAFASRTAASPDLDPIR